MLAKLSHAAARCVVVLLKLWALKQDEEAGGNPYAVNRDQQVALIADQTSNGSPSC